MSTVKSYRKKDQPFSQPVNIISQNDNFFSLSNGDNVLKTAFIHLYDEVFSPINENTMQSNSFSPEETVDASSFFNSSKIVVVEDENQQNKQSQQAPQNHNQVEQPLTKIDNTVNLKDELFDDEVQIYGIAEATKRKAIRDKRGISTQVSVNNVNQQYNGTTYVQPQNLNPSEMMFKSFKRNHDITIKLEFKDKIGNPDFVKMMLENIDGDIVQYYKNLIMENITNQIKLIEDAVEEQIRTEIFDNKKLKKQKQTINQDIISNNSDIKNNNITETEIEHIDEKKLDLIIEPVINIDDIKQTIKDNSVDKSTIKTKTKTTKKK